MVLYWIFIVGMINGQINLYSAERPAIAGGPRIERGFERGSAVIERKAPAYATYAPYEHIDYKEKPTIDVMQVKKEFNAYEAALAVFKENQKKPLLNETDLGVLENFLADVEERFIKNLSSEQANVAQARLSLLRKKLKKGAKSEIIIDEIERILRDINLTLGTLSERESMRGKIEGLGSEDTHESQKIKRLLNPLTAIVENVKQKLRQRAVIQYKNKLAAAKRQYIEAVQAYNSVLERSPKNRAVGGKLVKVYDSYQPEQRNARIAFIKAHNQMVDLYSQEANILRDIEVAREMIQKNITAYTPQERLAIEQVSSNLFNEIDSLKDDSTLKTGFTRELKKIDGSSEMNFNQARTMAELVAREESEKQSKEEIVKNGENIAKENALFTQAAQALGDSRLAQTLGKRAGLVTRLLRPLQERLSTIRKNTADVALDAYTKKQQAADATYAKAKSELLNAFSNTFSLETINAIDFNDPIIQEKLNGKVALSGVEKEALDQYVKAFNNRVDVYKDGTQVVKKINATMDDLARDMNTVFNNNNLAIDEKAAIINRLTQQANEARETIMVLNERASKNLQKISINNDSQTFEAAFNDVAFKPQRISLGALIRRKLQALFGTTVEQAENIDAEPIFEDNPFILDYE